jgi:hypothetical protein
MSIDPTPSSAVILTGPNEPGNVHDSFPDVSRRAHWLSFHRHALHQIYSLCRRGVCQIRDATWSLAIIHYQVPFSVIPSVGQTDHLHRSRVAGELVFPYSHSSLYIYLRLGHSDEVVEWMQTGEGWKRWGWSPSRDHVHQKCPRGITGSSNHCQTLKAPSKLV